MFAVRQRLIFTGLRRGADRVRTMFQDERHLFRLWRAVAMLAHGPQHALRVGALLIDPTGRQPPLQRHELVRRQSTVGRISHHARVRALRIEQLLRDLGDRARRRRRDDSSARSGRERGADVDHRLRHRHEAMLGAAMNHRDLVIVFEDAVAVLFEDLADPLHAERGELRGTERTHARAAVDVDALRHGPEDLLVPDGRNALEVAVDDPDRPRFLARHTVDVTLRDGRKIDRVQLGARVSCVEGRAREDVNPNVRTQPRLVAAPPGLPPADHGGSPAAHRFPRGPGRLRARPASRTPIGSGRPSRHV